MGDKKAIQRLKEFIDYKSISLNSFDVSIGASNGYIGRMIKNNASIGSDVIEKISCVFPELNLIWLITGEGDMTRMQNIIQGDRNPVGNNSGTITGHNIGDNSINVSAPVSGSQKIIYPDRTMEIEQLTQDLSYVAEQQPLYMDLKTQLGEKEKEIELLRSKIIELQAELIQRLKLDK